MQPLLYPVVRLPIAPPTISGTSAPSSSPSLDRAKDKVLRVCGTTINDGKPMVECTSCGVWSHLRLTQRK